MPSTLLINLGYRQFVMVFLINWLKNITIHIFKVLHLFLAVFKALDEFHITRWEKCIGIVILNFMPICTVLASEDSAFLFFNFNSLKYMLDQYFFRVSNHSTALNFWVIFQYYENILAVGEPCLFAIYTHPFTSLSPNSKDNRSMLSFSPEPIRYFFKKLKA